MAQYYRTEKTEALKMWAAHKKANPKGLSRKKFIRTNFPHLTSGSPSYAKRGIE